MAAKKTLLPQPFVLVWRAVLFVTRTLLCLIFFMYVFLNVVHFSVSRRCAYAYTGPNLYGLDLVSLSWCHSKLPES